MSNVSCGATRGSLFYPQAGSKFLSAQHSSQYYFAVVCGTCLGFSRPDAPARAYPPASPAANRPRPGNKVISLAPGQFRMLEAENKGNRMNCDERPAFRGGGQAKGEMSHRPLAHLSFAFVPGLTFVEKNTHGNCALFSACYATSGSWNPTPLVLQAGGLL
jgi:hypothetical protein